MTENELSQIVIGESIYIHRTLGPGLLESAYHHCLLYRLIKRDIHVESQKNIPLIFEEVKLSCGYRCDLLIENKILVELKTVDAIHPIHSAQLLTYLRLSDIRLGLIINFNVVLLKNGIKRIVNQL